jgi:hypothetical protein
MRCPRGLFRSLKRLRVVDPKEGCQAAQSLESCYACENPNPEQACYNRAMMNPILARPLAIWAWGAVVLTVILGVGCSKPNRINPADAAQVRSIDATIERLRQAYVNKDPQAFRNLLMPLDSLRRLELEVERDFAIYDRITLDLGVDRVLIEGTDVGVYFHWQGQWKRRTDDQPVRERGHAILRFVGHENLALSGVEGDAPFGMASRRLTGERSGGR